ncbi:MAG: cobalamin biosynthesis protein P47K [Planctomycetales bacterium]|nr:cobalamin biosynthesis protein P47K [Planctomycetales bacterium]
MTNTPRFIMIGGFLGAGKTTTIARLANHYRTRGMHVAIVTNDQAVGLVDTNLLRAQGFNVGEVAGSCFCCNFNELTSTVERLGEGERPDVILAEPVGSCTDLVATVIRPLQQIYAQPFDISPFGVIIKPSHGLKILKRTGQGGFSPQAEYIFRKQIEEADFIILNRIDELTEPEIDEICQLVEEQFPGRPIVKTSAKTGVGCDDLIERFESSSEFGQRSIDVDYDVYAIGEAELGWLNAEVVISADTPFDLDRVLLDLVSELQQALANENAETAHLKVIGMCDGQYGVANVVSNATPPAVSLAAETQTQHVEIVVNARVAIDPQQLEQAVRNVVSQIAARIGGQAEVRSLQSFRPGRPVPTYRLEQ